jgi:hypothetical protein
MRIIFSRKGFDSASGGTRSPIIDGVPYGLPIPTDKYPSETTYGHLSLGDRVSQTNKDYTADSSVTKTRCFRTTDARLVKQAHRNLTCQRTG